MTQRSKMPRIERAKQFAPFDALKGLHEALYEKEKENEKNMENIIMHIKDKDIEDSEEY